MFPILINDNRIPYGIGRYWKEILPYDRNIANFPPIQTLKDWEEQQGNSSQQVVRRLKDLRKRIRA